MPDRNLRDVAHFAIFAALYDILYPKPIKLVGAR